MFYAFIKVILTLAIHTFYRIKVKNKHLIPQKGGLIVVSNHPNTFMDPMLVGSVIPMPLHFLANSGAFSSKFNRWLFKQFNMIPIRRKEDKGGLEVDNQKIFQKCYEFLGNDKGALLIFPEGGSVNVRRLRELKSGAARIALGTEASLNFQADLKIITIGLNYQNPRRFRSEVLISIDEPIEVKDFKTSYLQDSFKTTRQLTDLMRKKLERHILHSQNEQIETTVKTIEHIEGFQRKNLFENSKKLTQHFQQLDAQNPSLFKDFQTQLENYTQKLQSLHLPIYFVKHQNWNMMQAIFAFFQILLGFPFYLVGIIFNFLPFQIAKRVGLYIVKITKVQEYFAPTALMIGVFGFPIFYGLYAWIFYHFFDNFWLALLALFALVPIGFWAWYYEQFLKQTTNALRFLVLFRQKRELIKILAEEYQALQKFYQHIID